MSTSETFRQIVQPCPCGAGKVVKEITTQDNPWSGADISYWIECGACSGKWDLSRYGGPMTLRSSLKPWEQAQEHAANANGALNAYLQGLAAQHFAAKGFATKKAEHAHLVELGIFDRPYKSYLDTRKNRPMHEIGYLPDNPEFVSDLVGKFGDTDVYDSLTQAVLSADNDAKEKSVNIIRQKLLS